MLLMAKNDISGGICHAIHRYEKTNNNYMNDYDVLNDKYWWINDLYGWKISQMLPLDGFKWSENTSQFNKGFIENYNEDSDKGYFLEVNLQ